VEKLAEWKRTLAYLEKLTSDPDTDGTGQDTEDEEEFERMKETKKARL